MLRLLRVEDRAVKVSRRLENPATGVALINCTLNVSAQGPPLHWRVGNWKKPPIDIEIDPTDGHLSALQVVLQDEGIAEGVLWKTEMKKISGIPFFDLAIWPPKGRYLDEHSEPVIARSPSGDLWCAFERFPSQACSECAIDHSLVVYFDSADRLIGFGLRGVSSFESDVIRKARTTD